MENLTLFFSKIKELTFWQRIFSWRSIRKLSYDAFEEFRSLADKIKGQGELLDNQKNELTKLGAEKKGADHQLQDLQQQLIRKDNEIINLNSKVEELTRDVSELSKKVTRFESAEDERQEQYEKQIGQVVQVKEGLAGDKKRLEEARLQEQRDAFEQMKKTWSEHETDVENTIRTICQGHLISYVDKVPFRGNPDNTIEICGEYIIFDAKSPANDDLSNFPTYIKTQTESLKKYAKHDGVKKEIFLVVPTNTIDSIKKLVHNMGDYNVYVITKDALQPIILSLKKIEEYEFAEQLSPEERDNICRIIGKFAHTTKRRIQIDQFFAHQFLELLVKCKNDLPEELLDSVLEFEKAEKLNPPTEKRTKQILTKDLQTKNDQINAEAQIREIDIPGSFDEVKGLE